MNPQYFCPENFAINQLVVDLKNSHSIELFTDVPNYPEGNLFDNY